MALKNGRSLLRTAAGEFGFRSSWVSNSYTDRPVNC
jgi:hypothetical protein